jgi:uncharacterized protein
LQLGREAAFVTLTDRYRRPADLPDCIPVFPLRGAILLPRANLPLNIFEPRYLAMFDDALAGDRIVGLIQPDGGSGMESPLGNQGELRRIGCAGRITSYQELDDGRLGIILTGLARFELVAEVETGLPYRSMKVSYDKFTVDFDREAGEDEVDRERLLLSLKNYLEHNQLSTDWNVIERASCEFLINALSVMSPFGPEEKQALLEAPDLKTRSQVLMALSEMDRAQQGGQGGTLQ